MDVSISIVSYNTKDILERCLASIYENTKGITFEVFVVDNNSQDGSPEMVKTKFPQVNLIENKENLYFTKANNQAIKLSKGRYILILNSDTYFKDSSLEKMVCFMDEHTKAGAIGPQFLYPNGERVWSANRYQTFLSAILESTVLRKLFPNNKFRIRRHMLDVDGKNSLLEADLVSDACVLLRRKVLDQVGIYDEQFSLYYTEDDLCSRIRKGGWKIYHVPWVQIVHLEGQSANNEKRGKISQLYRKDMLHYFQKHHGYFQALILKLLLYINLIPSIVYRWAYKTCSLLFPATALRRNLNYSARVHDMCQDRGEQFYGSLYLRYVFENIKLYHGSEKLEILDAGCGPGRIAIPLAKSGHRVLGIDISDIAIRKAEGYALKEGVTIQFKSGELHSTLKKIEDESFDVAVCLEVTYSCKDYEGILEEMRRVLKPCGLLMVSFRTKYYYVLTALSKNDYKTALFILKNNKGKLWGQDYNWFTIAQIQELLNDIGVNLLSVKGIGCFSGISQDPLSFISNPAKLNETNLNLLYELESNELNGLKECSRYVLAIGLKENNKIN